MATGFFLVWNAKTGYTRFRHNDRPAAEREAERLAGAYPGEEFMVLAAVSSRKIDTMQRQKFEYRVEDEIPF